jgi:hypothetical protein
MVILFSCLGVERIGCDYAVVTLTEDDLKVLAKRREAFLALHAEDRDLSSMAFWSADAEFFPAGDWINTAGAGDEPFVVVPEDFDTGEEPDRTECDRMVISKEGVLWSCYPKHDDAKVETHEIPWEQLLGSGS